MRTVPALMLAAALLVQAVLSMATFGAAGPRGPPATGDWTVNSSESLAGQTVHLKGNLVVGAGGSLSLSDVTLYIDAASDLQYGIFVRDGGTLSLTNSYIMQGLAHRYAFNVTNGSMLSMNRSAVTNTDGPRLDHSSFSMVDSIISGITLHALWLNASYADLLNSTLDLTNVRFDDMTARLNVSWNLIVSTGFLDGTPASGANITITNRTGGEVCRGVTDGAGNYERTLREYFVTDYVVKTYDSPYNVSAEWGGGPRNETQVAVDHTVLLQMGIDRNAPAIAFTYPASAHINSTSVEFRGTCTGAAPVTTVELSRDNGTHWTTATDTGGAQPWSTWNCTLFLPDGTWTVIVRANDTDGQENRTSMTVTTDTVAPSVEIFSPAPACVTNAPSMVISGRTDPDASLAINHAPLATSAGYFNTTVPLDVGWNSWTLRATDPAGNRGTASVSVLRDITPPNLTVLSPENDFLTNLTQLQFQGQTDADATVTIGGSPATVHPDGGFNETVSLVTGNNVIEVKARDPAGNAVSVSVKGFMDNVPPFLNAWAAVTLTNQTSVLVFGETEPGSEVSVGGTSVPLGEFGNFSATVGLVEGNNRITVSSSDRVRNYNFAVVEVLQDSTPPGLAIQKPQDGAVLSGPDLEVCGTASDANGIAGIEVGVDDQNYSFAAGTTSWRAQVIVPEGNHTIDVLAYDRAGNAQKTSRRVSYVSPTPDRTPPALTVIYPVEAELAVRNIEIRGHVADPSGVASVEISRDNRSWKSCTLDSSRTGWSTAVTLRPGQNSFYIRSVDTLGNNGTRVIKVNYSPPPTTSSFNLLLPIMVVVLVATAAASVYMVFSVWSRWTDQIEPGLGEDEALITFPGKGLK